MKTRLTILILLLTLSLSIVTASTRTNQYQQRHPLAATEAASRIALGAPYRLMAGDLYICHGIFSCRPSPTLHDVDGDGVAELFVGTMSRYINYTKKNGDDWLRPKRFRMSDGKSLSVGGWNRSVGVSLQFIDFNADGKKDILSVNADSIPLLCMGSDKGFLRPEYIVDRNSKLLSLGEHFDKDHQSKGLKSGHVKDDRTAGVSPKSRCLTAIAHDWDNDGDLDLVMSDNLGGLWLSLNEGEVGKPLFSSIPTQIMLADKPFNIGCKITNFRIADWDGDGLLDIVVGTFKGSGTPALGGGIKWLKNTGEAGKPKYDELQDIIEGSPQDAKDTPTRPDETCYVDVVDYDNDGDLDLLVGGYSKFDKDGFRWSQPYVWVYLRKDSGSKSDPK